MAKPTVQISMDFDDLQWIEEIKHQTKSKNLSQTFRRIRENYVIMALKLANYMKKEDKQPESYVEVRTQKLKERYP